MNDFNLAERPWIPCLMLDGSVKELCILDALVNARDVREIRDDSPLVVVSLHRLLLAVLHRNFGPKNYEEWKSLWKEGRWDQATLKAYFDKWKHRFNLFDKERPFYQYPKVDKKGGSETQLSPVEILMPEKSTGSTLFDHTVSANKTVFHASVAARHLIARHSFSLAGGINHPFNLSNGLLVAGFSVLATGNNLFETLALNLVICYRDKPMPIQEDEDGKSMDAPCWESDPLRQAVPSDSKGTIPLGYLDYLTWQSRRIRLHPTSDFTGVEACQLQQNFKLKDDINVLDPFKVYLAGDDGLYPLNLNPQKSLWRDSHALFSQITLNADHANVFKHLAKISESISNGEIDGQKKYGLSVFGIINKQASIHAWSHESMSVPLEYFKDNELVSALTTALDFAEKIGGILENAMKKLRREIDPQAWESAIRSVRAVHRPGHERKLIRTFPAMSEYWSELEILFNKFLTGLPENENEQMNSWFTKVDQTAKRALANSANCLNFSAKRQRGIAKAERLFYGKRKSLLIKNSVFAGYLSNSTTKEDL